MSSQRDLAVIGGGTAGMAAAIYAAREGLNVKVFDAAGKDFDKPCGEGLMPHAVELLKNLGVHLQEFVPIRGIKYFATSESMIYGQFYRDKIGMGVQRKVLRNCMWHRAADLGVEISTVPIRDILKKDNFYVLANEQFRWVCLATGGQNRLPQKLGFQNTLKASKDCFRFGIRRHLVRKPWSENVEVYWTDSMELYVTPVAHNLVNLAILSHRPIEFNLALQSFPEVLKWLHNASWFDEPSGSGPLARRLSPIRDGNILLAGDAAGFLDAMTGEGNTLALQTGILAGMTAVRGLRGERVWPQLCGVYVSDKSSLRLTGLGALINGIDSVSYRVKWWRCVWKYWVTTTIVMHLTRFPKRRRMFLEFLAQFPIVFRYGLKFLSSF